MIPIRFSIVILVLSLAALACGVTAQPQEIADTGQTDGEELFTGLGCSDCHNGPAGLAPSLNGVYGGEVPLESGEVVTADEAYLQESILDSRAKVVQGYDPIMPEYGDQLDEDEMEALIQYIRSLGKED